MEAIHEVQLLKAIRGTASIFFSNGDEPFLAAEFIYKRANPRDGISEDEGFFHLYTINGKYKFESISRIENDECVVHSFMNNSHFMKAFEKLRAYIISIRTTYNEKDAIIDMGPWSCRWFYAGCFDQYFPVHINRFYDQLEIKPYTKEEVLSWMKTLPIPGGAYIN